MQVLDLTSESLARTRCACVRPSRRNQKRSKRASVRGTLVCKSGTCHSHWRSTDEACWTKSLRLPYATAFSRCSTVVDTVSKRARTLPCSPNRARCSKCLLSNKRSKKIECGTCEPKVTSMSYGRVYELIDLVSSSSIDITASVFNITAVLKSRIFLLDPLVVSSKN